MPQKQQNEAALTRDEYSLAYDDGYPLTVRFLLSRGLSGESAEEAAQAAWAKGWEHRRSLRNRKRVVSWVNTIALNLFRNWFRRRESPEELPEIATAPKVTAQTIDIRRTLEKFPSHDRLLMEKHYVEGYTSNELSKKTGCTPVAVRVRILRARRKLSALLRPGDDSKRASRKAGSRSAASIAAKNLKAAA